MEYRYIWAPILAVAVTCASKPLHAQESCATIGRENVVRCALAASMAVRAEEHGLQASEGRRTAASTVLPSNPTLSLSAGNPTDFPINQRDFLWSATLSQEIEIAGQRSARLGVAEAEQRGQQSRVLAARRDVAAAALVAYFDQLAALEEKRLAERLLLMSRALRVYSSARSEIGLAAPVEAQVAESASIRLAQAGLAAERRVAATSATLTTLVGLDPSVARVQTEGTLTPIEIRDQSVQALVTSAVARRPEIARAVAERQLQEERAKVFRRARFPNPTVSIFARHDWVEESAVGLGISFPIPLPSPIGHTNAGEIEEANALAERAETDAERFRRDAKLEIVNAVAAYASRKQELALFDPTALRKVEDALDNVAHEIEAQRLPLRDALFTQQSLIDLLFAHIEAQRQLCLASIELARSASLPLDRSGQ